MFLELYHDENMNVPINPKTKIPYTIQEYNNEFGTQDTILGNMVRDIIGTNLPNLSGIGVQGSSIVSNGLPQSGNTSWVYAKQNLSNTAIQTQIINSIQDSLASLITDGIVASIDIQPIYTNSTFNIVVYLTKPNGSVVKHIQKLWS